MNMNVAAPSRSSSSSSGGGQSTPPNCLTRARCTGSHQCTQYVHPGPVSRRPDDRQCPASDPTDAMYPALWTE